MFFKSESAKFGFSIFIFRHKMDSRRYVVEMNVSESMNTSG
jgi:hypothetical protein